MYKVEKSIFPHHELGMREEYMICDSEYQEMLLYPNRFIRNKSVRSVETGKQYAYKVCKYFNYLKDIKHKNYREANESDVHDFFYNLTYGTEKGIFYIGESVKSYNTLILYHTVLVELYKSIRQKGIPVSLELKSKRGSNKFSFFYGQVGDKDILSIIDKNVLRLRGTKEYVKWYTEEEKKAIIQNLQTLRDKSIFLMTCDGMRIGEVLSLRLSDYDTYEGFVSLYSSKGKETGNTDATVQLSPLTLKSLNKYLDNERDLIVNQRLKMGLEFPINLFLNLKQGQFFGEPIKYRNYLDILKRAAKHAGVDENIRTHSGRSSKTMDLIHFQSDHPEENLTDDMIRRMMRWKSPSSMDPYINMNDKKTAKAIAKKIEKYDIGGQMDV